MQGTAIAEALQSATIALTAAGCESPRLDAELLLADAMRSSRERLLIDSHLTVRGDAVRAFQSHVRRRATLREPVAYILGRRHFRRLELHVDARALIPRPETELLVEVGLGLPRGARVLDLGTGSGAIALALADERPDLLVSASDASAAALTLARENAQRLGLAVTFLHSDLLDAVPTELDAIVSNPPYVREDERGQLAPEIVRHEPFDALFAGPDGLAVIRRLVARAGERPAVKLLALEIGAGQAPAVVELMMEAGFAQVRAEQDLAGIERVVVGERP
ncbi:MAG: peptide chain release factor N(5)-glutamine methyltransferase [Solirubrobacteraceae bacterium]